MSRAQPDAGRRAVLRHTAGWAAGAAAVGWAAGCTPRESPGALRPGVTARWVGPDPAQGHAWRDGRLGAVPTGPVRRVHTLIVGGGVAGLSAAHALQAAGLDDLVLLEGQDDTGGNARGHTLQGLPCPMGAHYLPLPGPDARDVARWLEEIGLIRWQQGRWQADERHLCHSPQERVFRPDPGSESAPFWRGAWHEGLLPWAALDAADRAACERFARAVRQVQALGFAMPTHARRWHGGLAALDAVSFADWLDAEGHRAPALRWLLDYACRDDYGVGLTRVSAWAGLHYFASRHGFGVPGADEPHDAVLTWPEGNGWLTTRLAAGLGGRRHTGQLVTRVRPGRHGVEVDSVAHGGGHVQRWQARQVILCVPLFVARRLLSDAWPALDALAPHLAYAPWLVSNLLLDGPLIERPGAPLAWDNVPFSNDGVPGVPMPSLGYVNARHQSLAPPQGPMLLTHYWALGGRDAAQAQAMRKALLHDGAPAWLARVLDDLGRIHPELASRVVQADLVRHGHAMVVPQPGLRGHPALAALQRPWRRLHLAHSDLSAYSVFEEAFTHGVRAADQVLTASGMRRASV